MKKVLIVLLAVVMLCGFGAIIASAEGEVCEIAGGARYSTLEAAIDAVGDGQTIRLLKDIQ